MHWLHGNRLRAQRKRNSRHYYKMVYPSPGRHIKTCYFGDIISNSGGLPCNCIGRPKQLKVLLVQYATLLVLFFSINNFKHFCFCKIYFAGNFISIHIHFIICINHAFTPALLSAFTFAFIS